MKATTDASIRADIVHTDPGIPFLAVIFLPLTRLLMPKISVTINAIPINNTLPPENPKICIATYKITVILNY